MAGCAGAKTTDQPGSHAVHVSKPEAAAVIIEETAKAVSKERK